MNYVHARPRLPAGHPLPAGRHVERAVFADGDLEIYEVVGSHEPAWLLCGQAVSTSTGPMEAVAEGVLLSGELVWLGPPRSLPALDPDALSTMCDALSDLIGSGFAPSLAPPHTWWGPDGPVLPIRASDDARVSPRDLARWAYWTGVGVDLDTVKEVALLDDLGGWRTGTSRVVSEALVAAGTDPASTLDTVRQALRSVASPEVPDRGVGERAVADDTPAGLARVGGMHALKKQLVEEVVEPLRNPAPYESYGLGIPNGMLLYGPPGCGKTYVARALAEELGYAFEEVKPSSTASPLVHESALQIAAMFEAARAKAPAVLFIDEFDAFVPDRAQLGSHQHYRAEEVNEFLSQLNDVGDAGVFVIAASNYPEKIDPAVRRAGRIDKLVYVSAPDTAARAEILQVHLGRRPGADNVDAKRVALDLEGYAASDLRLLVDEAARAALAADAPISDALLFAAAEKVPPSVSAEDDARYREFTARG